MEPWAQRIYDSLYSQPAKNQSDLARACHISRTSVSNWFGRGTSTRMISGDNLVAAAKYLGVSAEWIMTGKDGHHASQSSRLDPEMLSEAIDVAMAMRGPLSSEKIVAAYELLTQRASVTPLPDRTPPIGSQERVNDIVAGPDSGAKPDPRRAHWTRKK